MQSVCNLVVIVDTATVTLLYFMDLIFTGDPAAVWWAPVPRAAKPEVRGSPPGPRDQLDLHGGPVGPPGHRPLLLHHLTPA